MTYFAPFAVAHATGRSADHADLLTRGSYEERCVVERSAVSHHWLGRHCPVDELQSQLKAGQWCVFGVPVSYDYPDGTRGGMGPLLIRKSLPFLWAGFPRLLWDWTSDRVVETATQLPLDLGDIPYDRRLDRACDVEERIASAASDIARLGGRPLVLGGEHWLTYPVLRGMTEHIGPVYVVHFDAHSDTHRSSIPRGRKPSLRNSNVMTFVESLDGIERILQIGLREYDLAVEVNNLGASDKCIVISADEVTARLDKNDGVYSAVPEGARVYVTIDADVLDPAFAPEVGWPVPGGLTVMQLFRLLRELRQRNEIIGLDLVEVMGTEQGLNRAALAMARCALALVVESIDLGD
ncbi:MAG: arginase family protein [Actinomycetota bacterium]|nr:arginase family protein [Actinomycetota bacterium]